MTKDKITPLIIIVISITLILIIYFFIEGQTRTTLPIQTNHDVEVLRERDTDMDGLSDFEELERGLNSNRSDTDGDGLFDWYEIYKFGTDPLLFDTDGDGISDGVQVRERYRNN